MFSEQEEKNQQEKQELENRINYALGFIKHTNQKIKRTTGKLIAYLVILLGGLFCSSVSSSAEGDLQTFLKVVSILSLTTLPFSLFDSYKMYKMVKQRDIAKEDVDNMLKYYQACYGQKQSPFEEFDDSVK